MIRCSLFGWKQVPVPLPDDWGKTHPVRLHLQQPEDDWGDRSHWKEWWERNDEVRAVPPAYGPPCVEHRVS